MLHPAFLLPTLALLLSAPAGAAHEVRRLDDEVVGLRRAWATTLGPSYSRVAVSGRTALTQFSDGESGYVVALETTDGSVLWKRATGAMYYGHDGSEDGPISSPVLGLDSVFVLDPRGKLLALDLATGAERWSMDLVEDLGAELPSYGFTSTPVLEAGLLIVQVGGSDGRNLCALDAETGELRWSSGEGAAAYQSPTLLELAGRRQLIVLNANELQGVAPETGELLWSHSLPEGQRAATGSAGAIDDERFFLYTGGRLAVFRLTATSAGFTVEPLYRTRELGNTYAKPVHRDGYLYGFNSTFLTCVDAATGKRVWKSRPPGGRGLTLVDDRLVVFGSEGVVAIIRATPEGYTEEARIKAFEHSGYTWPSFADGRIFVRNSKELVCIELVERGESMAEAPEARAIPVEGAFGAFLRELAGAEDSGARIDAFLAEQESFPIVDGDQVHFVYRGEAEDVAIGGSMTGGARSDSLFRVEGTDLFYRTYSIEPGARWEYTYQVDYGPKSADPLNPRTSPGRNAPMSNVTTVAYVPAAHLAAPTGVAGRIDAYDFTSEQMQNTRGLQVYLPPGYDDGEDEYPLLLLHDGPDWIEKGLLKNTLDNLIGVSVEPLIVVFVAPLERWWFESGGSRTEEYLAMLATELMPDLEERYRISASASDHALAGVRGFGLTAAFGVVAHPDVFGKAAIQSVSLGDVARHAFFEQLAAHPPAGALFYVDWNRYEQLDLEHGYDFRADSQQLVAELEQAECRVVGGEARDSHGWGSWRARSDAWLSALFPRM